MRRPDYFERYNHIQRLNVRGPVPGVNLDPRHVERNEYAKEILIYFVLILFSLGVLAGSLWYIRHRDRIAAGDFINHYVNPCQRCHAFELQFPPTLDTRAKYARHYNHNKAVLAYLVRK